MSESFKCQCIPPQKKKKTTSEKKNIQIKITYTNIDELSAKHSINCGIIKYKDAKFHLNNNDFL